MQQAQGLFQPCCAGLAYLLLADVAANFLRSMVSAKWRESSAWGHSEVQALLATTIHTSGVCTNLPTEHPDVRSRLEAASLRCAVDRLPLHWRLRRLAQCTPQPLRTTPA